MNTSHTETVLDTIEAVRVSQRFLDGLHKQLHQARAEKRSDADLIARDIGSATAHIRLSMKIAEVCATLAVADRLDALVRTIDAQRLTTDDVEALIAAGQH